MEKFSSFAFALLRLYKRGRNRKDGIIMTSENETPRAGGISVKTEHIFPVIKKWLYSEKEIFLRELVSNACDAATGSAARKKPWKSCAGRKM